jgi:hypothetical protein
MDEVQKPSDSECYTPSSEPFHFYQNNCFMVNWAQPKMSYKYSIQILVWMLNNTCKINLPIEILDQGGFTQIEEMCT